MATMIEGDLSLLIPPFAILAIKHLPAFLHLAGVGHEGQVFISYFFPYIFA
jgi:hypothetical protein